VGTYKFWHKPDSKQNISVRNNDYCSFRHDRMKNGKLNRLKNFDYSQNGMYFVTICVKNREHFLGEITKNKMHLSDIGKITRKCWQEIPSHFPHISLDEFIVMPNHIHGIIEIINVGNNNYCSLPPNCSLPNQKKYPWQTIWSRSLSSAIRGFKIGVTKWCNQNNHEYFSWQRSFHDRVIRNDHELNRIREYIFNNPAD
jgi:putative transposase